MPRVSGKQSKQLEYLKNIRNVKARKSQLKVAIRLRKERNYDLWKAQSGNFIDDENYLKNKTGRNRNKHENRMVLCLLKYII